MSTHLSNVVNKISENHRRARGQRDLQRAIANAPTQASRDELITIAYR